MSKTINMRLTLDVSYDVPNEDDTKESLEEQLRDLVILAANQGLMTSDFKETTVNKWHVNVECLKDETLKDVEYLNALNGLRDCNEVLHEDTDDLSEEEKFVREELIDLCTHIANDFKNVNI